LLTVQKGGKLKADLFSRGSKSTLGLPKEELYKYVSSSNQNALAGTKAQPFRKSSMRQYESRALLQTLSQPQLMGDWTDDVSLPTKLADTLKQKSSPQRRG